MDAGDLEFCQSLLPKGTCILDFTEYCETPQMIEWKLDCGYLKRDHYGAAEAIRDLAAAGQLELMKRVAHEHTPPPQDADWTGEWYEALLEACKTGRLSVVKWLLQHPTCTRLLVL
ncbi:DNA excision repair protein ERCC-6 [Phytophthora pseudosyringae]|uniref:DNA excision repair protein ERCC-6 n=1 Tax=Phytophthora pseudosyringae TaxID=221518 RepID=A0A8T1VI90_9STRA|nr:DNA excision repair protein ERCC-6 [Phytophthora pseudosyringae]